MASSSDWLTALLDRPLSEEIARPLDWLPDLGKPNEGFVARLPFDRPPDDIEPQLVSDELSEADTCDALEDILLKALAEREAPASEPVPLPPLAKEELETDLVAEAFARGEAAGRHSAMEEQEALSQRKVNLRQACRILFSRRN